MKVILNEASNKDGLVYDDNKQHHVPRNTISLEDFLVQFLKDGDDPYTCDGKIEDKLERVIFMVAALVNILGRNLTKEQIISTFYLYSGWDIEEIISE